MTPASLVWKLLRARSLSHLLAVAIVALGLGLMLAALATADAARSAMSAMAARYPLVVGGEIGAVPLVLGSLTTLQDLGAGIDGAMARELADDPRVEAAVPLLGGHAVAGHPVLATSPAYLQPRERYPLSRGRVFHDGTMEAVVGADAATALGVAVGDHLTLEHAHAHAPRGDPGQLTVVGLLAPTGTTVDDTVFCPVEAIHMSHGRGGAGGDGAATAHEHGGDGRISAVLVRPVDDAALLALQEELDARDGVQVALTGQTLRRVSEQLASGGRLLRTLVGGVVAVTLLGLLLSLVATSLAQTRDVALLRVVGMGRWQVVAVVAATAAAVVGAGAAGGLVVGQLLCGMAEELLTSEMGLEASVSLLSRGPLTALAVASAVLVVVGAQPAVAAYSIHAAEALAEIPGSGRATRGYLAWVVRVAMPAVAVVFVLNSLSQHGAEGSSSPPDEASMAIYETLLAVSYGQKIDEARALDGTRVSIQGYMVALGDPYTVDDFYLVVMDPRLPRCPFCYRSPGRFERIHVTGDGPWDLIAGLVRVDGILRVDPDADAPAVLELTDLDIVLP